MRGRFVAGCSGTSRDRTRRTDACGSEPSADECGFRTLSEDLDDGPRGLLVCGCLVDEPASQVAPVFRADGQVLLEEPRLPTRSTAVLRGSVFGNPPLDVARAKAKVDPRLLEALVSVRTLDAASGAARWRPELDDAVDARLTLDRSLLPAQRPPHGGVSPQENALTLVVEVRTVVDELQLGKNEDVLLELPQEALGFQRSCIHDIASESAVADRVQGVDNDPEGGAVLGVVRSDGGVQPHVGLVFPPTTPKRALKTRYPGFGPPKAEVDGNVL